MVLAEGFKMGIEFTNAIFVGLGSQFCYTVRKLLQFLSDMGERRRGLEVLIVLGVFALPRNVFRHPFCGQSLHLRP